MGRFPGGPRGGVRGSIVAVLLAPAGRANAETTFAFSESRSAGAGWNGQTNEISYSSDGLYKLEFFWLNTTGHNRVSGRWNVLFTRRFCQTTQPVRST